MGSEVSDVCEDVVKRITDEKYHCIYKYTQPVRKPVRPLIGRDREIRGMKAALERPELCNILLLAEAGAGKSACVAGLSQVDTDRLYLEVDLAKMIANCRYDANEMAGKLKSLFDDTEKFCEAEHTQIVLFMDEFHQIVQLSDAAVEAMKPLLANSGVRGIRVIAATTPAEFRKNISPNQPLVERLQRINLHEPDRKTTIQILKSMAESYGVAERIVHDSLYELIYEYTQRYIPANAQPRKSLLILDAMIGWYRSEGAALNKKLLAHVLYESEGINVMFKVDATKIRERLDERVLAQKYATYSVANALETCVADLSDLSEHGNKPQATMLFSGSTGTGKTELAKAIAEMVFNDERALIRFDMTEYANPDSLDRFRKELTSQVWNRPCCVILLDEIEKACDPVVKLLLPVLDEGRLQDENNREVTFINAYIILTTNAGTEVYKNIAQYQADDEGMGHWIRDYSKLIFRSLMGTTGGNKFPPELLGRIECVVPFQPLSENTQMAIARMRLQQLQKKVFRIHNCKLRISKDVIRFLVQDSLSTDSDAGGARAIISKMKSDVVAAVATFLNRNPDCYEAVVTVAGTMAVDDVHKRVSTARIVVKRVE